MKKINIRYAILMAMLLTAVSGVWADGGYFLWGTTENYDGWSGSNAASGSGPWTVTLTGLTAKTKYYVAYSTSSSKNNLPSIGSVGTTSGLQNSGTQDYNGTQGTKRSIWFETSSATSVTIECTTSYAYNITAGAAPVTYTASATGSNCTFDETSKSISASGSVTFTVTPSSGYKLVSASVTNAEIDKEDLEDSTTPVDITVSNPTDDCTLSIVTAVIEDPDAPIVYFGNKPVQSGAANVTASGYLVDRKCKTVTATGFYWGTSIADCKGHTHSFVTDTNPAVDENGETFSKEKDFSSDLSTGTNLYLQAYVTTNDGSAHTGYSDVVGFFFNPCNGITSVTVEPSSVELPDGESVTLQAVARGAAKGSTYTWKEGVAVLQSGYSSSYTYTKTSGDHSLTVTVDDSTAEDGCGTSRTSSAVAVTDCDMPEFSLPENMETSPWMATAIEVSDGANFTDYKWSVTPTNAKLTDANESGATFRADALSDAGTTYTVSFTAIGDCTGADIEVTKTVEVTVKKDEGCK